MENKYIHIVAFNVPYPADYGGAIDVFFKLKSLHNAGIKIYLHCFVYGKRKEEPTLEKYCEKVFYYKRNFLANLTSVLPFIVVSRKNKTLLHNLIKYPYPIFFEGLHTCYYLSHPLLQGRKKMVRMHNIEHDYYHYLYKSEKNILKKCYYKFESVALKKFEKKLSHADMIFAISPNDFNYYKTIYENVNLLYPFHGNKIQTKILKPENKFILYHGNLSVSENHNAAIYLVNKVFSKVSYQCIIAGNNPSKKLLKEIEKYDNIKIIEPINKSEMNHLISAAHINVLPTFQPTGIKLKLINTLFIGKFILVNKYMVQNTPFETLCIVCKNENEFITNIETLYDNELTNTELQKRNTLLNELLNDEQNVRLITDILI